MGVSDQRHAPAELYPREGTPGTHLARGWVSLSAGLNTEARGNIIFLYLVSSAGRLYTQDTVLTELPSSHLSRYSD
jgi:hypothetical protein